MPNLSSSSFKPTASQAQMALKLSPLTAGLSAQLLRLVFLASLGLSLERCLCGESSVTVPRAFGAKVLRPRLRLSRVLGGIQGKQFENEGCMLQELKKLASKQEALAHESGKSLDRKIHQLETSKEFILYAEKHGADVDVKGKAYARVSNCGVWWALRTNRQAFRKKEVKHVIITAFKAMGIAFVKKS
ncbi:unnamed protein product [Symbiodinium necroappetens]|uniref:Uncharacterized protein n=1 Tax=Symbiodinium necroappetens TaxID=1628268 RepID=A0A812YXL9_9DINO|nr:unnamed protein product [Symbiodinium necroappetens]